MPRQTQRRMARMPQITETTPAPAGGTASNAPDVTDASNQPQTQTTPPRPNKTSLILALMRRKEGATLAELVEATGWLPHTTRAALTGLRKKGHVLDKTRRDDATCYRVAGDA